MSNSMLEKEWSADPLQPGRIAVGDAITIQVQVAFWRVKDQEDRWSDSEAMRLVKETEALVLASKDMAKALLAFVSDHGHTPDCGHSYADGAHVCSEECAAIRAALKKAGVPLP